MVRQNLGGEDQPEGQLLPSTLTSGASGAQACGSPQEARPTGFALTHSPPVLGVWEEQITGHACAAVSEQYQDTLVNQSLRPACAGRDH